jgi:Activator of Hsp90 ATPase homolog 1-like protein
MTTNKAVFRVIIDGKIEAIWHELTKQGEAQAAVFNAWLHAQTLAVGQNIQIRTESGEHVLVIGKITAFAPPHRFAHTFCFTQYDDPECEVIYELKQLPTGVECTLIVDRLPVGTKTAKEMQSGGKMIVNTLKCVVETGKPSVGIRVMYWLFGKMEFVLPKKTASKHWPL